MKHGQLQTVSEDILIFASVLL